MQAADERRLARREARRERLRAAHELVLQRLVRSRLHMDGWKPSYELLNSLPSFCLELMRSTTTVYLPTTSSLHALHPTLPCRLPAVTLESQRRRRRSACTWSSG